MLRRLFLRQTKIITDTAKLKDVKMFYEKKNKIIFCSATLECSLGFLFVAVFFHVTLDKFLNLQGIDVPIFAVAYLKSNKKFVMTSLVDKIQRGFC